MHGTGQVAVAVVILGIGSSLAHAQTDAMWDRRDPKAAYLFNDYRARQVGDVLTIVVNENTGFQGQETRNLNKQTNTTASLASKGAATLGSSPTRQYSVTGDNQVQSQRKFDGQANSTIDRKFSDTMTVMVVDVLPNGNLIIEGYRRRVVSREMRMLKVTGVVRPADIGPFNQIQSQYIANFNVIYEGRGPETNYSNQGWGGRIFNVLWPF
jgi:flagellar L-ring protein precursor FlgH